MVSPPILALTVPGVLFGLCGCSTPPLAPAAPTRGRCGARGACTGRQRSLGDVQLAILGPAWFIGTWLPYELQSALDSRTSYLYYMVVVMPGIYVAATYLVSLGWRAPAWLRALIGRVGAERARCRRADVPVRRRF